MADLMTAVWEFEKLQTQYKDFRAPAVSFVVGGTDLAKGTTALTRVEAVLSLDGASSVRAEFGDCYDMKNSSFASGLKNAAVPGKTVELSLGYQSSLEKVFKGYLSNVRVSADAENGYTIELVGLDVRRLMMTDNFHIRTLKIKNYSDAVTEILKRYKKLASPTVDATNENLKDALLWQNSSDYDFITKDLIGSGRADREFFAAVDKIYFRKPRSVSSPVMTLRPGGGLVSFETDGEYINTSYEVLGFDPAERKPVSGKADAKTAGSISDVLGGPGEWFVSDPACVNKTETDARAKNLADAALHKTQRAVIRTIGLPQLLPGRYIKIDKIDSLVNKKYYITRVTHTFDDDGFRTSVETEGWE